ncbi:MAG: phosphate transport system regulatory protein PhoU [Candidatus Firestonebacteria bacterium RIFOXYC2_FULL_39_67]|nr:MAG: phosphate transport system regulatory protein PhoU [Candidatus Firestonebacteria bacterium RIFOXYD2_FULL_39_29]OGF55558.1 MAG: phosphate transport system regulatory protein PhoU [Candidatus Firestonebacteria bacterium RIFOXYC2_FULL_39_67]
MNRHFDEELGELKERLLYMASLVESMINYSIKSLVERKEELVQETYKHEAEVNKIQVEIDDKCLKLIALHQPAAADLRFITSAMKINAELERMGDQAVNIADASVKLLKQPPLKPLIDTPRMAEIVKKMVKESLDSFVKKDIELAKVVLKTDDEVDDLKDQIFRELLTYMSAEPSNISRALELILISRHLERIGDHATNIAEDVIFLVAGKDIRHHLNELEENK